MNKNFKVTICILLLAACISGCSNADQSSVGTADEQSSGIKIQKIAPKAAGNPSESVTADKSNDENLISINQCDIHVGNIVYGSNEVVPEYYIVYQGNRLKPETDYTITFENQNEIGQYTAEITMLGKYSGSLKKTYYICPKGTTVYQADSKVSSITAAWDEQSENTDGYELEYAGSPDFSDYHTVIFSQNDDRSFLFEDLPQNTVIYTRIRTFKNVNGTKIYSELSKTEAMSTRKVEVIDGVTYIDGILIANKTYSLPQSYGDGEDPEAVAAFYEMSDAAAADGLSLYIVSGYRSYDLQNYIYHNFCAERGQESADRVSARPGHSEHQSGLAFDINSTSFSFSDTPEAKWIAENCYQYGFILRYPENKEDITGYTYESWHVRYLGKEIAAEVHESGLTLEEYLGITSKYAE